MKKAFKTVSVTVSLIIMILIILNSANGYYWKPIDDGKLQYLADVKLVADEPNSLNIKGLHDNALLKFKLINDSNYIIDRMGFSLQRKHKGKLFVWTRRKPIDRTMEGFEEIQPHKTIEVTINATDVIDKNAIENDINDEYRIALVYDYYEPTNDEEIGTYIGTAFAFVNISRS